MFTNSLSQNLHIFYHKQTLLCFYWRLWLTTLFQMSINDQIRKQQHDPSKIKQHNDNIDVTNLYISNLPRSFTEEVCLNLSFLCLSSPNFNILRYICSSDVSCRSIFSSVYIQYLLGIFQQLNSLVMPFGEIVSSRILKDPEGNSKGVGFAR